MDNNYFKKIIDEYHSLHYDDLIVKLNTYNCYNSSNIIIDNPDNLLLNLIFVYLEQLNLENKFEELKERFNLNNPLNTQKLFIVLNFILTNDIIYSNYFINHIDNKSFFDDNFKKILNNITNDNINITDFFNELCKLINITTQEKVVEDSNIKDDNNLDEILKQLCTELSLSYDDDDDHDIKKIIDNYPSESDFKRTLNNIVSLFNYKDDDNNVKYHQLLAVILAILNKKNKIDYQFLCDDNDIPSAIKGDLKDYDVKGLQNLNKFIEIYKCFDKSNIDNIFIKNLNDISFDTNTHSDNMKEIIDNINDFLKLHKELITNCQEINNLVVSEEIETFISEYKGDDIDSSKTFFKKYLEFCKQYKDEY